jgi:hypothetical protein
MDGVSWYVERSAGRKDLASRCRFRVVPRSSIADTGPQSRGAVQPGELIFGEPGFALRPTDSHHFEVPLPGPDELGNDRFMLLCRHILVQVSKLVGELTQNVLENYYEPLFDDELSKPSSILERPCHHRLTGSLGDIAGVVDVLFDMLGNPSDEELQALSKDVAAWKEYQKSFITRALSDIIEVEDQVDQEPVCTFGILLGLLNHSCQPNAELLLQHIEDVDPYTIGQAELGLTSRTVYLQIQAIRPIADGEEITISYAPDVVPESQDQYLAHLKDKFGFSCRCTSCRVEESNPATLRLKNDVFGLWTSIRDSAHLEAPEIYRRAAYILDGFEELKVNDQRLVTIWDLCADKAYSVCDMIRSHYFTVSVSLQNRYSVNGSWYTSLKFTVSPTLSVGDSPGHPGPVSDGYTGESGNTDGAAVWAALAKQTFLVNHK